MTVVSLTSTAIAYTGYRQWAPLVKTYIKTPDLDDTLSGNHGTYVNAEQPEDSPKKDQEAQSAREPTDTMGPGNKSNVTYRAS